MDALDGIAIQALDLETPAHRVGAPDKSEQCASYIGEDDGVGKYARPGDCTGFVWAVSAPTEVAHPTTADQVEYRPLAVGVGAQQHLVGTTDTSWTVVGERRRQLAGSETADILQDQFRGLAERSPGRRERRDGVLIQRTGAITATQQEPYCGDQGYPLVEHLHSLDGGMEKRPRLHRVPSAARYGGGPR